MTASWRIPWRRVIPAGIAALLVAAWGVPKIGAGKYREPVRAALESALGRKVEFSDLKFRLLPLPGFTITNLTIGEDPSIGAEPVAYVGTVRAVPQIASLLTGKLALASVDLEDATITLTRAERSGSVSRDGNARSMDAKGVPVSKEDVQWDFTSMMRPGGATAFPSVHMRSGRINFKFGDTKTIFYLLNTDVDLWPPARAGGSWTVRVRAQPARTDRPARGFGNFSARGQWRQSTDSVTLDVRLEESELGDMLTLFEGHESGILGEIHGDAHLAGPVDRLGVRGRLTVENIHGWDEAPAGGNAWPIWLSGYVNARGKSMELRAMLAQTQPTGRAQPPVDVRYRVSDFLGRPQWGVTAFFNGMPVTPLLAVARNLGARVSPGVKVSGVADGAASYAAPDGTPRFDGQVAISKFTVTTPDAPVLSVDPANLRLSGESITLGPATMTDSAGEVATVSFGYDTRTGFTSASIATAGMNIASLRRQISAAGVPVLGQTTSGHWSGALNWSGEWSGNVRVTNADIPFEAFSEPLHVRTAEAAIDGGAITIKHLDVSAGGIEASGEYRYEPAAPRPHHFRLNVPKADGPAIEKLLSPALRRGGFLNYALNFGRPAMPSWLAAMRADGTIQAAELSVGGAELKKVHAHALWDGPRIHLTDLQSSVAGGKFAGEMTVDLSQRQPRYEIPGVVTGMEWLSGVVSLDGQAETFGYGTDLLTNLHATGSFLGRGLETAAGQDWDVASGNFDWAWSPRNARLKLSDLMLTAGGETWSGSAQTQSTGELMLNLSAGERKMRLSEALFGAGQTSGP